eukprot:CAMPEP_0169396884 /NCGR_PEP_ID=MMETSP1017-20121227/51623_1 /TAXON_ID=342587 /ORGANISM="Karlodinium micrum, Strain CCMP2283" /LENGTH=148 /DNA_ID=CAMNT_0009501387 /DNA_START=250 /DNA_END=697 /DNA_ORIENTATION=+
MFARPSPVVSTATVAVGAFASECAVGTDCIEVGGTIFSNTGDVNDCAVGTEAIELGTTPGMSATKFCAVGGKEPCGTELTDCAIDMLVVGFAKIPNEARCLLATRRVSGGDKAATEPSKPEFAAMLFVGLGSTTFDAAPGSAGVGSFA